MKRYFEYILNEKYFNRPSFATQTEFTTFGTTKSL